MRKLLPIIVLAVASALMCLAFASVVGSAIGWIAALTLAAANGVAIVITLKQRLRSTHALDRALGSLAEYRLPESNAELPLFVQRFVGGYQHFIAELSQRHTHLTARLSRFEFMATYTDDLVMQVDARGLIMYVSPSVQAHLGYSPSELLGSRGLELLHPDDASPWLEQLKHAARQKQSVLLEGRLRRFDGSYVAMEMSLRHAFGLNGKVAETVSISRDVEARNVLRTALQKAALTDQLTGLPNRVALATSLEKFQLSASRQPFGLFLFDLDRFKQVNDSLGHKAGDEYLIETASRVRSILRHGDTLARMGGDEFVALFSDVTTEEAALAIAQRIIEVVTQPYQCHGALLHPKTSIGIMLCNDPDVPGDELISYADKALYEAKSQGGNVARVYDEEHSEALRKSFRVEQELSLALQEDRMVVEFQPIVDAKTKKPALAEVLVRLRREDGTLLAPNEFIEVAERTGLIFPLGTWVLKQACLHSLALRAAGTPLPLSVNVSPHQLMHLGFLRSVEKILRDTGAAASGIVLEVTESAVMQDVSKARATLEQLRLLGFKLALDDFGTGFSSIAVLRNLPFDILKIDRSLIGESESPAVGATVLRAIIDMGKSLKLTVIAEGIETEAQSVGLERLGCDLLQGFRFHRPMSTLAHVKVLGLSCNDGVPNPRVLAPSRQGHADSLSIF